MAARKRLQGARLRPQARVFALALAGCQGQVLEQGQGSHEGGCPEACEHCDRPNVVLVVMESTRHSAVTPYAPELPTTPFLDGLAQAGARVETAYTVVPHTSKALVGIECGYYPQITQEIAEASAPALPGECLAGLLRGAGYATFFIQPATASFEARAGLVANFGFARFAGKEKLPQAGFDESSYFGFEDDIMLAPALEWVDSLECPFFLSVLTLTAHHDYTVPAGYPEQEYAADPTFNDYLNTVAYTDRFIGELHAGLAERGLLNDTIFVVIGDHGEGFGEHGRTQHDNVIWEEGLRVPLILSGPGVGPPGRVIEGLFQSIDVAPTIARLVGLEAPAGWLGVDVLESAGHERLFFSCWYDDTCMAMREGARKAIYHFGDPQTVVHDVVADPIETSDISHEGDNASFAEAAVNAMFEWRTRANLRYQPR